MDSRRVEVAFRCFTQTVTFTQHLQVYTVILGSEVGQKCAIYVFTEF